MTSNNNINKIDTSKYKTEIIKDRNLKNDLFAKVEIVGDLKVGKTSLIKRLTEDIFDEDYSPTLGYEFTPYLIKVNDTILKFQIWDMCGNENYRSVLLNLYRNAALGILVYSVTNRKSFENLPNWITQLKEYALPDTKLIIIGNKTDDEDNRVVSYEEGKEVCEKFGVELFLEVSARNGYESPNFIELAAMSLYQDYINHKEDLDYSVSFVNKNESIMLGGGDDDNNKQFCCQ